MLIQPKIVVLDSHTLGDAVRDYWSADADLRQRCRAFINDLARESIYIGISFTHLSELFRYGAYDDFDDRLRFLRNLPMIAWLRPYRKDWHVDSIFSNVLRELDFFVHRDVSDWAVMLDDGRPECWETGTGHDMFGQGLPIWEYYREHGKQSLADESYIASIARSDPGRLFDVKLSEMDSLPYRDPATYEAFCKHLAADIAAQLHRHGDKRLESHTSVAAKFAQNTLIQIREAVAQGKSLHELIGRDKVPDHLISPNTTVGDFGDRMVFLARLKMLGENLSPPAELDLFNTPIDVSPSMTLDTALRAVQNKMDRAAGSNLGDSHLAALALYADAVEVDKRTQEHLRQIKRRDPRFAEHLCPTFTCAKYHGVTDALRKLNF